MNAIFPSVLITQEYFIVKKKGFFNLSVSYFVRFQTQ